MEIKNSTIDAGRAFDFGEREHKELLDSIAPEKFDILHYMSMIEWKPKNK